MYQPYFANAARGNERYVATIAKSRYYGPGLFLTVAEIVGTCVTMYHKSLATISPLRTYRNADIVIDGKIAETKVNYFTSYPTHRDGYKHRQNFPPQNTALHIFHVLNQTPGFRHTLEDSIQLFSVSRQEGSQPKSENDTTPTYYSHFRVYSTVHSCRF